MKSIIDKKRFVFNPTKDLKLDQASYHKLKLDLKKYLRSSNFKKLIKMMQRDIDKYFGKVITTQEEDEDRSEEESNKANED